MRVSLVLVIILGVNSMLLAQKHTTDTIPNPNYKNNKVLHSKELEKTETETIGTLEMVAPNHEPNKAALYSAIIPGLGQAYNNRYWKIPIVWAGLGAFTYFIKWNTDQYQYYRINLIYEVKQIPGFTNNTPFDAARLKNIRDNFRRNRDNMIVYGIIFYVLNIVDAHVDAHLIEFNVNQDLSVQLLPSLQSFPNGNQSTGLTLTFKF